MKIYTKTGDDGTTGLFGGGRVRKNHLRINAYGTVDELNSVVGLARTSNRIPELDSILLSVQNQLFQLGSDLATPVDHPHVRRISEKDVVALERQIDEWESTLPPLTNFILPGGNVVGAHLHLARTVCRRAERLVVEMGSDASEWTVKYLNRLSDFFFVAARYANHANGQSDILWSQP